MNGCPHRGPHVGHLSGMRRDNCSPDGNPAVCGWSAVRRDRNGGVAVWEFLTMVQSEVITGQLKELLAACAALQSRLESMMETLSQELDPEGDQCSDADKRSGAG
jgi:hypothetical protein